MPVVAELNMVLLIAYVSIAALVDFRTHRIPNTLTATAATLALLLQAWGSGWDGVLSAAYGAAIGLGIFLPFYILRAFGAGDIKAMAAIGVALGPQLTLFAAANTLIAGGIIGILILFFRSSRAPAVAQPASELTPTAPPMSEHRPPRGTAPRSPYGFAIAAGVLTTLLLADRLQFLP